MTKTRTIRRATTAMAATAALFVPALALVPAAEARLPSWICSAVVASAQDGDYDQINAAADFYAAYC